MKKILAMAALAAMGAGAWAAELKLSLQAYTFRDRSFVETVETAARLGYENLEAYPGQRLGGDMKGTTDYRSISPEALAQLKAYLAKAPVKVVSYGVTGAGNDQEWEKLMAFCRELGIVQVQVEVGIAPDNLARAERHAKDSGVRVSLHNHRQPAGRPENVLKALEGFGPMIGAGCDIGHWQNAGIDPVAGVKLLKGRFHCIHAIDSSGPSAGNKDVALGSGVVDFVAILDALKANETGTVYVTVEDERQYEGLEADVAASARWFKAWAAGTLPKGVLVGKGERIAFMGDSITANGNRPAGYVNMVMKGLELAGVKAEKVAVGVSGNKSNDMLARLEKDVLSRKVQWMTLSCGVNDVWHGARGVELEDYKVNIGKILDACAAANIKVIVLTATMIREDASNKENQKLAGYNAWLREEAARRGLLLADLNADMQAELARIREKDKTPGNKLTVDGVHMAFPGDCMMAWGVLKAMGLDDSKKDEIYAAWRKLPEAYKYELKLSAEENDRLLGAGICPGDLARRALDAAEGWSPVKWNKAAFESGVWKMGVDGVMTATKDDAIWSDASYENFELDFDYKLDPAANSGVIIYAEDTKNWIPNAIEIQLLDDNHERWKKDGPHLKNASLYGHVAPVATPAKPAGQWNHMNIKAVGQQITVTVNGVLALDYSLAKLTDGKVTPEGYKIPGHLPRPWSTIRTSGPIGLQGKHGGALPYFRNVRIRKVK